MSEEKTAEYEIPQYKEEWPLVRKLCIPSGKFQKVIVLLGTLTEPLVNAIESHITLDDDLEKDQTTITYKGYNYAPTGRKVGTHSHEFHNLMHLVNFLSKQIWNGCDEKFRIVVENDPESEEVTIEFLPGQETSSYTSQSADDHRDSCP